MSDVTYEEALLMGQRIAAVRETVEEVLNEHKFANYGKCGCGQIVASESGSDKKVWRHHLSIAITTALLGHLEVLR